MSECSGPECTHADHDDQKRVSRFGFALGKVRDFFRRAPEEAPEVTPESAPEEAPRPAIEPGEARVSALRFAKDFAMLQKSKHAGGRARYLGIGLTKRIRKLDKRRRKAARQQQRASRAANRVA